MLNVSEHSGQHEDGKVATGVCIWKLLLVFKREAPEEHRGLRQISEDYRCETVVATAIVGYTCRRSSYEEKDRDKVING